MYFTIINQSEIHKQVVTSIGVCLLSAAATSVSIFKAAPNPPLTKNLIQDH